MVIVDASGRIVLVNAQTEKLFGYRREELLGRGVDELVPARYRAGHGGHRADYLTRPHVRPMGSGREFYGLRKDGSEFPVEISLSPIATAEGMLIGSSIRDITERKRIEDEVRRKSIELEKAVKAKDRFLASMSHELRTPLNAIIGFTGTLLMRLPGPLTADQESQLKTIQASARHLLSLINDLLDLAKIDSGHVELRLEPVACDTVLLEVASSLGPLAAQKGLLLKVDAPGGVVVQTDRRALSQILLNLTGNAIKFTEKGYVRLRLSQRVEGGATLTEIGVEDTGTGIRPEDQARLFGAFQRLDAGSTRRHEGTGLGLHLSQKLAGLLGGQIVLRSEWGKGSTFTLELRP